MSRAYSSAPIPELTDAELREILVTCDGRGKEVKAEALDELMFRVMAPYSASVLGVDDSGPWERGEQTL